MTFAGRWRGCYAAILALACAVSALAQPAPPQARVAGHVLNQAGEPLRNATVALVGNNPTPASPSPPSYTATSSAAGEFAFEKVEPNSYRLFVQRAGYLEFIYSEPDGSVSMPIAQGQQKAVEIRMAAPSFLSGRITDENGEAFPDARVTILRASRSRGKNQLARVSQIVAGRDGIFATGSLTAGRYYLAASAPPSLTQTNQREVHENKAGSESYVNTYFPSALDAATATSVDLAADTEVRNLDIRLRKARIFHIYGKTVNSSGAAVSNITINLRDPAGSDPLNSANRVVSIGGIFSVNGLLPGTYGVQAWSQNRSLQAHQTITLADRDLEDVVVTLAPALEIPLSVRLEGADPERAQAIRKSLGRFTLTASDGLNVNAMAQSKDDGWIFRNIGAGTYRMGIGGPDGTYVKSIRLGNQDITLRELDTTLGAGTLEVVLSPHAAEVSGAVLDGGGKGLSGVMVTLWAPGLPPAGAVDQAWSTRTDAQGRFRFERLRPGEYRVAAWETIGPGLADTPEFRVRFEDAATTVKVGEDARETVQAPLIGRERIDSEAAKLP